MATTYYEILKISPTASANEVQAAIDAQYDQWRRLVAHHKPEVVEQANQRLRVLETIRATLTDPAKRAVYDASLNVGGLADPEAVIRMHGEPPPPPLKPRGSPGLPGDRPVDAWVCPQCGTTSPRGTRFCSKCRAQIGIDCPKCKRLTLQSDPYCAECGADLREELERERRKRLAQEAEAARLAIARAQAQIQVEQNEIDKLEKLTTSFWAAVFGSIGRRVGCLVRLGVSLVSIPMMLLPILLHSSGTIGETTFSVLFLGACIIGYYLIVVILRRFARESILKDIQTHQDRIAQLQAEIRAISMKSMSQE